MNERSIGTNKQNERQDEMKEVNDTNRTNQQEQQRNSYRTSKPTYIPLPKENLSAVHTSFTKTQHRKQSITMRSLSAT